jgi:hypothetical protein
LNDPKKEGAGPRAERSVTNYLESAYERMDLREYVSRMPRMEHSGEQHDQMQIPPYMKELPDFKEGFDTFFVLLERRHNSIANKPRIVVCSSSNARIEFISLFNLIGA